MGLINIASSSTTATVIGGDVMRGLVGVPTADVVIDQIDGKGFDAGAKVTISSDSGYQFTGVVDPYRTGDFLDAVHVRVLGGAGGMLKPASAKNYIQPSAFARDVLNGLMTDSGESLSSITDAGLLTTNLQAWSVIGGNTVARNLKALLDIVAPSMNWRILQDGTLWIGNETWGQASGSFDLLYQDPTDQSFHLGNEVPFMAPGTSLPGVGNIGRVHDTFVGGKVRTRVWVDIPGTDRGINAATQSMAKQALAGVDYYATYICQVVAQSSDLTTMDVSPVGDRNKALLGGFQRVPVRYGNGIKVKAAPGSTVLVGFDGGNPEFPFVLAGFSGDTALKIQLAGTDPVVTKADIDAIKAAISGAAVVAQDGGAAFKANILAAWPVSVGSQIVQASR